MKVLGKLLTGAVIRAFTNKNGGVVTTKTPENTWDLEAVLAWFLRGLLLIFLYYLANKLGVDVRILQESLPIHV